MLCVCLEKRTENQTRNFVAQTTRCWMNHDSQQQVIYWQFSGLQSILLMMYWQWSLLSLDELRRKWSQWIERTESVTFSLHSLLNRSVLLEQQEKRKERLQDDWWIEWTKDSGITRTCSIFVVTLLFMHEVKVTASIGLLLNAMFV